MAKLWKCRDRQLSLEASEPGVVMGILNVTPDSFSDGGAYVDEEMAIAHALAMVAEGAGIIDVGGESTRPGAAEVSVEEEMQRILPVVAALHERCPEVLISIDTSKATVAHVACQAGASIVNDVTALCGDPEMAAVVAESGAGLVLMHMQGTPRTMQADPKYKDVVAEVVDFLDGQRELAMAEGVADEAIVLDPGVGFGKTADHNWEILRSTEKFHELGRPLLMGVSRKSFLGSVLDGRPAEGRAVATAALTALLRRQGILLHRVHDVRANVDALRVAEAMFPGGAR